jgi:holo-[acyl-carrier protein] synthase
MTESTDNKRIGIGCDIIEVDRIKARFNKQKSLMNMIFTESEISYIMQFKEPHERIAGFFSAKESVAKALGTGISNNVNWKDIVIEHNTEGKPFVKLINRLYSEYNIASIEISISHCQTHAIAYCYISFR